MTDSNGVKPSNEELQELINNYSWALKHPVLFPTGSKQIQQAQNIAALASAELQRRQQPEASVPAELVAKWYSEACKLYDLHDHDDRATEYVANKAAAYGRGQSQQARLGEPAQEKP